MKNLADKSLFKSSPPENCTSLDSQNQGNSSPLIAKMSLSHGSNCKKQTSGPPLLECISFWLTIIS